MMSKFCIFLLLVQYKLKFFIYKPLTYKKKKLIVN